VAVVRLEGSFEHATWRMS